MTSLLTKSALKKLPAEVRDHIIVENETGYSITLSMSIGDFERLVAPHDLLDQMRHALTEAEAEAKTADERAEDAEAEAEDALKERDAIAKAVQALLGIMDDEVAVRADSPLAAAIEALEDLL